MSRLCRHASFKPVPKPLLDLKIRVLSEDDVAIGPGKAALLAAIGEHGSISAAARALGMSYRRAWLLVETMNRCFTLPLVVTHPGGRQGGGAALTPLGIEVLARYIDICAKATTAIQHDLDALGRHLKP